MKNLLVVCLLVVAATALPRTPLSRFEGRGSYGWLTEEGIDAYNRIIGGSVVEENSLPYQAGNFMTLQDGRTGFCGGVIISDLHVLTAAHCWWDGVNRVVQIEVHLGAHRIQTTEPGRNTLVSRDVIMHPAWTPSNIRNDIAVINLPRRVEFTDKIQPVALPPQTAASNQFVGSTALASGWGRPSDSSSSISSELRQVTLSVITNARCAQFFSIIHSSHLCTEAARVGTCSGDSGGPLVTTHDGQTILIGLTSFGTSLGCEALYPSAFVRVTEFLSWISQTTNIALKE